MSSVGIPKDHPEATCDMCGGPNYRWFVESRGWNKAMRDPYVASIVCPNCFMKQAEARGIGHYWEIRIDALTDR